ncbi:tetratricopeptide repeat protein [Noviherbaspirillum suwonense]|uniref:Tetratricopeptide repeat-containing protein n=1 Tax=Noviherbaspirillum suwonense TaxID=1224511 RepID=A0ABY1PSJ1_9BURK|nr:tetratricopeptide repeat protein [Noviherbaspirillum suwonense]SMP45260.1 Tetratricopeptide repeat-containing protein [Noviherbaspirillum suwonense]
MSPTVEYALRAARVLQQQGAEAEAVDLLKRLLSSSPACVPALQMLGLLCATHGDMRGAVRLLRQGCVVEPENGPLRLHLARVEWEVGMPAQAAASYEQAIACHCASADVRVDYAIALQALKQGAAALAQCDQAIQADPHHARAWNTKAGLLHMQDRFGQALCCHERAIAIAPSATAWTDMAATLSALGRLDESVQCHDKALDCDPADAIAWTSKGATLAKMGQHRRALGCHLRATGLDPALAIAWSNTGVALACMACGDEALAAHDKAVSLQPASPVLWLQRGEALMDLGRAAESLASFNAAIRLEPSSAAAWHCRAVALCNDGRLWEALESLDETICLDATHAPALLLRAEVLQLLSRDAGTPSSPEQASLSTTGRIRLRLKKAAIPLTNGDRADGGCSIQRYRRIGDSAATGCADLCVWTAAESIEAERRKLSLRAVDRCRGAA